MRIAYYHACVHRGMRGLIWRGLSTVTKGCSQVDDLWNIIQYLIVIYTLTYILIYIINNQHKMNIIVNIYSFVNLFVEF
jgi:hypothetical protein